MTRALAIAFAACVASTCSESTFFANGAGGADQDVKDVQQCPYHYRPIRRLSAASEIPAALAEEEPFILGGDFVASWPGWKKWSLDYFVKEYGESESAAADGEYPTIELKMGASYFKAPFSEIASRVRKGELVYGALSLDYAERSRLMEDAIVPPGMDDAPIMDCLKTKHGTMADEFLKSFFWSQIFVGAEGTGMEMHKDNLRTEIWSAQLTGEKQLVACNPRKSGTVYPEEYGDRAYVNAFDPDMKEFPNFAQSDCVWGALQPGELIHWPSTWYHQTKNTRGISLAVSGMSIGRSIASKFLVTLDNHIHSNDNIGAALRECIASSDLPAYEK